jgi:hypothetical protein
MPDQPGMAQDQTVRGTRRDWTITARRVLNSHVVRWGFIAVAVGLGAWAVAQQWSEVGEALVQIGPLAALGALIAVLVAMLASMQVWRVLLTALGSALPVRAAARVVFVGALGKYVPGSVWSLLAQMELGTAHQVPRTRSATASVLAMLVSLLGGFATALLTLPFVVGATPYRWTFLAAPILLAALHPRVLNPILSAILRLAKRPALERPLTGRAVTIALAWSLTSWLLYGLQIWLLADRLGVADGRVALLAAGGFAFAWSLGFLVVLAPAGAGVREVLLVALLGPVVGTGGATAIALVSRVLMTVGDLTTAAAAAWHRPPNK